MTTIADRIRVRLTELHLDPTPTSVAAGMSPSGIRNILEGKSKNPRSDSLNRLARELRTTPQWLSEGVGPKELTDRETGEASLPPRQILPPPNASAPVLPPVMLNENRLPVLGAAIGGADGRFRFNGDVIEYVERPDFLRNVVGAYGVYIQGDSMFPRYKPGELVWVHPNKPPKREDDVIVQLFPDVEGDPPEGYVKEFRAWTPKTLVLWQYNPAEDFAIERPLVMSVHVIVGRR